MTTFPTGFQWGASTAAHQIEGNNLNSDFWALENAPNSFIPERSGDACDSYHRWPTDLDLLAETGLGAYRFSLDWSRIEPSEGNFSRAELAHYRRIIDGCVQRGITPIVTLHHFTHPRWFTDQGGWSGPNALVYFDRFVRVASSILDGVADVVTINEPNMVAMMVNMFKEERRNELVAGAMPPPDQQVSEILAEAHGRAREILHQETDARVGWTIANQNFQAAPGAEEETKAWAWSREDFFIEAARSDDFIGVQAYTRVRIGKDGALPIPDGARTTLTGWEYYPPAIGHALRHTAEIAPGIPLLVTENGIATSDDDERIAYTHGALSSVAEAISEGVPVRGYLHWSWLDNYEWGSYLPTFGLVAVDRESFVRSPRRSATWLGAISRANALQDPPAKLA